MDESGKKSSVLDTIGWLLAIILIVGVSWIVITSFIRARSVSVANGCMNNLREVDGAINQWALEKQKATGDTPTWDDIKPYIKLGSTGNLPKCPQGGKYTLRKVGDSPQVTCSIGTNAIPWHVLP